MAEKIIYLNQDSGIPLFGLDFIGIIDRGTNIIELKPLTLCNIKCRYCFVSAGEFRTNFIIDPTYFLEGVRTLIDLKGAYDIEIHIAPYGEIFLYKDLLMLLDLLWQLEGITTISIQTNGLLLTPSLIKSLESVNVTRLNISINTLNEKLAQYLSGCENYDINSLMKNVKLLLESNIDVLIAPVWFPGVNDEDIEDIISFVVEMRTMGYSNLDIQLGIQKYLIYRTGRKLKKIRPKTWGYFYQQLGNLEERYDIKLKLGPHDFNIHDRPLYSIDINEGEILPVTIKAPGRWKNECIGVINELSAVKVLLNSPLEYSDTLLGKNINVKILKSTQYDSIITTYLPY
ncbi:MAG: Cyclic pyranopterin monophosphate synthase [Promethearchaeota archaeon]|nr:MAG: Cyclic pyranopterin monophosphate synthase [Candidatus Lokiarchaeota archaeon]